MSFARRSWFSFHSQNLLRCQKCLNIGHRNLHVSSTLFHRDSFKILFLGRDEFSCLVLRELYAARDLWKELHIATYPDEKTGRRGSHLSVAPLKLLAKSLDLPIHTIPPGKPDFKHWKPPLPFSQSGSQWSPPVHHLLITASFGRILHSSVLHFFAEGRRLNVHPSLLPAYRGAAPIQRALINRETETGVCVIEMMSRKQGIDAGGILDCSRIPIPKDAVFTKLRDTLGTLGGNLLVSVMRSILAGKAKSVPQSLDSETLRASVITAADSIIDFNSMTAEDIVCRHRAISHQRALTTHLPTGKSLQLHAPSTFEAMALVPDSPGSAIYHGPSRSLLVRCANGSVLSVPRVKQQDRMMLEAKEWWNGVKGLGQHLVKGGKAVLLGSKNRHVHDVRYENTSSDR